MMTHPRTFQAVLISSLVVMMCGACRQAANAPANSPAAQNSTATPVSTQSGGIETETVAPQPIAGVIPATGKILIPEDRVCVVVVAAGRHERIDLDERIYIQKQLESLVGGELSPSMLLIDPNLSATEPRPLSHRLEPGSPLLVCRHVYSRRVFAQGQCLSCGTGPIIGVAGRSNSTRDAGGERAGGIAAPGVARLPHIHRIGEQLADAVDNLAGRPPNGWSSMAVIPRYLRRPVATHP